MSLFTMNVKASTIIYTGLLVGSLDIAAAFVDYYIATGNGPAGVLRFIASGVFGSAAFTGSNVMLLWGLMFHYMIAFGFTILFFWVYPRVRFMATYPLITVVLYGIFIWMVTALVIVPLSNTSAQPMAFWKTVKAILILIFMISLPLMYAARWKHRKGTNIIN